MPWGLPVAPACLCVARRQAGIRPGAMDSCLRRNDTRGTKGKAAAKSHTTRFGRAAGERSIDPSLADLLNVVSATLKPKVFCVGELADQSAGYPDFGLYAAKQVQRSRPVQRDEVIARVGRGIDMRPSE